MRETVVNLRRAVTALAVTVVFCITMIASMNSHTEGVTFTPDARTAPVPHGCWTGEAPKDVKIPGHVWAIIPGGKSGVFGPVWTGKALDQQFGKDSTFGLTVLGFCR